MLKRVGVVGSLRFEKDLGSLRTRVEWHEVLLHGPMISLYILSLVTLARFSFYGMRLNFLDFHTWDLAISLYIFFWSLILPHEIVIHPGKMFRVNYRNDPVVWSELQVWSNFRKVDRLCPCNFKQLHCWSLLINTVNNKMLSIKKKKRDRFTLVFCFLYFPFYF